MFLLLLFLVNIVLAQPIVKLDGYSGDEGWDNVPSYTLPIPIGPSGVNPLPTPVIESPQPMSSFAQYYPTPVNYVSFGNDIAEQYHASFGNGLGVDQVNQPVYTALPVYQPIYTTPPVYQPPPTTFPSAN